MHVLEHNLLALTGNDRHVLPLGQCQRSTGLCTRTWPSLPTTIIISCLRAPPLRRTAVLFPSSSAPFFAFPAFTCGRDSDSLLSISSRRTVSLRSRPLAALVIAVGPVAAAATTITTTAGLMFVRGRARRPAAAPSDGLGRGVLDDELPAVHLVVPGVRERGGGVLRAREVDEGPAAEVGQVSRTQIAF